MNVSTPTEYLILENCNKLVDFHAWPPGTVEVNSWLSNFDAEDRGYALYIVSQFMFFSEKMVDALFFAAFQNISIDLTDAWQSSDDRLKNWNSFMEKCYVVPVQGEDPNPSDSGYLFARKARQILGISECQLVDLEKAITIVQKKPQTPIVFVDDFVGSGEQFVKTWNRKSRSQAVSFKDIAQEYASKNFFYCNAITTSKGKKRIERECPDVTLKMGNILGGEYSWVSEESKMWPDEMKETGIKIIEKYSKRLGYVECDGCLQDWRGFHCLGLGLAFQHSTPDASLPIFYAENNWQPLVRRK